MNNYIYEVQGSDGELYYSADASTILEEFGTMERVTRYLMTDPEDITDAVNGNYYYDES